MFAVAERYPYQTPSNYQLFPILYTYYFHLNIQLFHLTIILFTFYRIGGGWHQIRIPSIPIMILREIPASPFLFPLHFQLLSECVILSGWKCLIVELGNSKGLARQCDRVKLYFLPKCDDWDQKNIKPKEPSVRDYTQNEWPRYHAVDRGVAPSFRPTSGSPLFLIPLSPPTITPRLAWVCA